MLMLGSYVEYGADSEQFAWLQQDLASVDRHRTPWVVVGMHAPWFVPEAPWRCTPALSMLFNRPGAINAATARLASVACVTVGMYCARACSASAAMECQASQLHTGPGWCSAQLHLHVRHAAVRALGLNIHLCGVGRHLHGLIQSCWSIA